MQRYFFHSADGQRCIDRVGTMFDTELEARTEMVRRAGAWIASKPDMLITNRECSMEVTLADLKPLFSMIMFSTDPRSFGKGR